MRREEYSKDSEHKQNENKSKREGDHGVGGGSMRNFLK